MYFIRLFQIKSAVPLLRLLVVKKIGLPITKLTLISLLTFLIRFMMRKGGD